MARVMNTKKSPAEKKPRAPRKPKDSKASKVVKKKAAPKEAKDPKPKTAKQLEAEKKAEKKRLETEKSAHDMMSFVKKPKPVYMTQEQYAQKQKLIMDRKETLKSITSLEEKIKVGMERIYGVKEDVKCKIALWARGSPNSR